ncbi:hypothetical protein TVAG_497940 [Trichomonas vaginalis G3]|uniref:Uncharacterized protein n=1 Tax=Trichomonas vaginalis (strain ATCC PRA-98 / G3) TaxID=412133 RepID=A2FVB3_TRIV3|nr:hypothetical protein TVAGG3_0148460 [Trichomonas vaginalis G3]EAX91153.1 hypothetical protein TVAG_497940 [Trichomonas vaginalis G3]KAI5547103.1 hypothetical protein TVAGG3_0148460 [Trichomonas vaginalis G3]|eukprot:XP_001304083.1 hypothetical protein [Trichomonas vaginalis G3]
MLGSGQAKEFLKYLNELVNSEDSYFPDYERFVLTVTDFLKFLYIPKVRMKMFAPILDKFKYFFDIEPENSNHIENMIVENLFRICRCEDSTVDFDHVFHQIVKRACAYQFTDLEAMSKFLDSLAPEITFDSDMIIGLLLLNDIDADDCIGKMLDCLHIPTLFVNIINDVIQIDYDGSKFARIIARLNSKRLSPEFIKYSVDVLESKAEELYKNDYNFLFFFMALDELLGKDCFDVFKRYLVLDFGDLTMDMILKIYNDHNINDIELYKCLFDTFSKFFITKPSEIFSETQREDILYNLRVSS